MKGTVQESHLMAVETEKTREGRKEKMMLCLSSRTFFQTHSCHRHRKTSWRISCGARQRLKTSVLTTVPLGTKDVECDLDKCLRLLYCDGMHKVIEVYPSRAISG